MVSLETAATQNHIQDIVLTRQISIIAYVDMPRK